MRCCKMKISEREERLDCKEKLKLGPTEALVEVENRGQGIECIAVVEPAYEGLK